LTCSETARMHQEHLLNRLKRGFLQEVRQTPILRKTPPPLPYFPVLIMEFYGIDRSADQLLFELRELKKPSALDAYNAERTHEELIYRDQMDF